MKSIKHKYIRVKVVRFFSYFASLVFDRREHRSTVYTTAHMINSRRLRHKGILEGIGHPDEIQPVLHHPLLRQQHGGALPVQVKRGVR